MDRREFVTATGTASLALLAGCLTEDDDTDETDEGTGEETDKELPDDVETVLGALPDAVDGESPQNLLLFRPGEIDADGATNPAGGLGEEIGLSPSEIDLAATTNFAEFEQGIAVVVGSFTAEDVDAPPEAATHIEDELAIGAIDDEEPWEAGRDAAVDAFEDSDAGLYDESLEATLAPAIDHPTVQAYFDPNEFPLFTDLDERIELFASGRSVVDETTEEVSLAVHFESEDAVDESAAEEVIESDTNRIEPSEVEFTQREQTLIADFEQPLPSGQLPDDSPDARFGVRDETLVQNGSEAVSPANLELRVDDEPVEPPWEGRDEQIEPGEEFDLDFEPFSSVEVNWLDPEREDVVHSLGRGVVGADDAFSGEYDTDANELTISYSADATVDTDRFELSRSSQADPVSEETPLSEFAGDTLESDDSFTVSDVTYGDHVAVQLSTDGGQFEVSQMLFRFSAEPGRFSFDDSDDQLTVTYRGDPRSADQFQLESEETEIETQFADEHDELTSGDSIEIAVSFGETVTVEWTGNEEPLPVDSYTVAPEVTFDIEYDDTEQELTITHEDGETVDAERLGINVFGTDERISDEAVWVEEFDTVSAGDSITVSLDGTPDSVWVVYAENEVLENKMIED